MKQRFLRIIRWQYFWLCLMLISTVIMHVTVLDKIKTPILDEVYYAGHYAEKQGDLEYGDAYNIISLHNDARPEHPPLAKLFIVAGIETLGDNPWGWRIPSVVMGTVAIALFFFICRGLKMPLLATNLATFFLAFDNLNFMFSGIAMLDVFMFATMLIFFLLYIYRQYIASGIFIGIAATTKLFAVMGAPTLFIHWLFDRPMRSKRFIFTVILAPISFLAAVCGFDAIINHRFANPLIHIKDMLSLSTSLTFANVTHPALSRPWEWLLSYRPMAFAYSSFSPNWLGGYTAAVGVSLWVLMIPILLYMTYRTVKQRSSAALFGVAWFVGTFLIWIPISIATNRVSFVYYFYPTIGALCLGLGMGLHELITWMSAKRKRVKIPIWIGISVIILAHLGTLVILSPVFIRS